MRATREMFMRLKVSRSAIISAAALAALGIAACGELTGPKSPSTPTNVVATLASASSATITWTPSPLNDGVVSYSVYRNGGKVGESATPSYTDTGLAQQTTYVYSVAANCKSGVISDRSVETTQSTVTTIDITAPRVVSTIPVNGATGVSRAGTSTVLFSEPMDPTTINTTTFNMRVTASGALIAGAVTYSATTRVAEFIPTTPLPNLTNITVTVTAGAKDLAGNALSPVFTAAWTTRDEDGPTVIASTPSQGAVGVSTTPTITVTFSEAVDATTVNGTNIVLRTAGGVAVAGTVSFNATTRVATFAPTAPLTQGVTYSLTVNGVKDVAGNAMPGPFVLTFSVGDLTAPTVTAVVPATGGAGIALNTTVKVTFSEAMDATSITTTTFNLKNTLTSAVIPASVVYDAATTSSTLTPTSALAGNTNYTVTVTTGAKDAAGNPMSSPFISTFTTVDAVPPTVLGVVPTSGANNVATNAVVQVTFSEAIDQTTLSNITLKNTGTSAIVPTTVSYDVGTNRATLTPTGPLSNATNYTVTVGTGVKDLAGNSLAAQFVSTFTTIAVSDNTPPTIVSRTPGIGATGVATNTTVTVTFNEAMDATTINTTTISLKPSAGGSNIAATVTCNTPAPCLTGTLTPTAPLLNDTNYTVTVTTGVKDVAGNALAAQATWTFTTIIDTTAPTVTATSPANGTTVAAPATITVTFSEDMDPATLNGTLTNFTVKTTAGSINVPGTVSYNTTTRVATFTPTVALLANTGYTVTVTTGAKDLAGNGLTGNFTFLFTTSP